MQLDLTELVHPLQLTILVFVVVVPLETVDAALQFLWNDAGRVLLHRPVAVGQYLDRKLNVGNGVILNLLAVLSCMSLNI